MEPRYSRTLERWGGEKWSVRQAQARSAPPSLCQQSLPVLGLLGSSGFQQISGLYWQPKAAEDLLELLSEHMSSISSHELQDSSSDSQVLILQILSVAPALH